MSKKDLYPVIDSEFDLINILLRHTADSIYDTRGMSSTTGRLYRELISAFHTYRDHARADLRERVALEETESS